LPEPFHYPGPSLRFAFNTASQARARTKPRPKPTSGTLPQRRRSFLP